MLISQLGKLTGAPQILHVSGVVGVTSGAGVVVSFWASTACCSAERRLRVSFAFLAASLRFFAAMLAFFVTAALTPAARCFRLAAAFFPAARCFLVAAAFFAVAPRFVAFFMVGSISGRAIAWALGAGRSAGSNPHGNTSTVM